MLREIFRLLKSLDTIDTAFSHYMREAIFKINKPAATSKGNFYLRCFFPTEGLDVDFDNQSITDIGSL